MVDIRVASGLNGGVELQLAGEILVSAKKASTPDLEVDKSLASIRSHRSENNADQDDVPFGVKDWSPSPVDVATDGTFTSKQTGVQVTVEFIALFDDYIVQGWLSITQFFSKRMLLGVNRLSWYMQGTPCSTCFFR